MYCMQSSPCCLPHLIRSRSCALWQCVKVSSAEVKVMEQKRQVTLLTSVWSSHSSQSSPSSESSISSSVDKITIKHSESIASASHASLISMDLYCVSKRKGLENEKGTTWINSCNFSEKQISLSFHQKGISLLIHCVINSCILFQRESLMFTLSPKLETKTI